MLDLLLARRALLLSTACALPLLTFTLTPRAAEACGGTFCDGGASLPMPVDQTGENILFVVDHMGKRVQAHIQIQYTGEPQNFAWVIPVTSIPDRRPGSEQLFTNLLAGTVPSYSLGFAFDCQEDPGGDFQACGGDDAAETPAAGDSSGGTTDGFYDTDGDTGGVKVLDRDIVGPFYMDIIEADDAEVMMQWLGDNGYQQDPDAKPILQEYIDEGHVFVAVKLVNGADVDEILPLVIEYDGVEPCVPLRLTRIAAVEDMGVRAFFLGAQRVVPTNFKHALLNPARIDWVNAADNYSEVVTRAVDEAEGQAFVTEFVGSASQVSQTGLYDEAWAGLSFTGADSPIITDSYTVIDALEGAGLVDCSFGDCSFLHPMIRPILSQFLPAPAGVAEVDFWSDLGAFADMIDAAAWDGAAMDAVIQERIVAPGKEAVALLDKYPTLTRLFTTISPHEMTADPTFHFNGDITQTVDQANSVTQVFPCRGSTKIAFTDVHELLTDLSGQWPELPESTPWALAVQVMPMGGAPMVVLDNTDIINAKIDESNERFEFDNGERGACSAGRQARTAWGLTMMGAVFGMALWTRRRRRR